MYETGAKERGLDYRYICGYLSLTGDRYIMVGDEIPREKRWIK